MEELGLGDQKRELGFGINKNDESKRGISMTTPQMILPGL